MVIYVERVGLGNSGGLKYFLTLEYPKIFFGVIEDIFVGKYKSYKFCSDLLEVWPSFDTKWSYYIPIFLTDGEEVTSSVNNLVGKHLQFFNATL